MDSVPAFQVKFGANDLNFVDVPLNPTHSLTLAIAGAFLHVKMLFLSPNQEFSS